MEKTCSNEGKDWVAMPGSFALNWGLPSLGLVAAMFLEEPTKAVLCPAALAWMGIACFANAARCRRIHCYFTGPFFLLLALLSFLHGLDIVRLGPQGWAWIALTAGSGGPFLWWAPEQIMGKYARRGKPGNYLSTS